MIKYAYMIYYLCMNQWFNDKWFYEFWKFTKLDVICDFIIFMFFSIQILQMMLEWEREVKAS